MSRLCLAMSLAAGLVLGSLAGCGDYDRGDVTVHGYYGDQPYREYYYTQPYGGSGYYWRDGDRDRRYHDRRHEWHRRHYHAHD